jgi:hypothetical protein
MKKKCHSMSSALGAQVNKVKVKFLKGNTFIRGISGVLALFILVSQVPCPFLERTVDI